MSSPIVPRFNVLGVGVSALTFAQACDLIAGVRGQLRRGYICCGTAHGLTEARADPELRNIFNASWLTTPDGMPLVWLGRWEAQRWTATARLRPAGYDVARDSWRAEALAKAAGPRGAAANDPNAPGCAGGARGLARPSASRVPPRAIERVYGPDLMLAVCDQGRASGLTHYFYGGAPGVAEELRSKLRARFPGLNVAGTFTPPFRPLDPGEIAALQADVARVRPDVIWVGLGTPKQERFMARHWRELDAGVLIGVGAAFDFHSGRVRQAPRWMQRSGFEWLFRLGTEPRRLGPRYLKTNPLFALRVLAQRLGLKKYSLER